jgi:PHP family Zn ribbon phosphoesterase
MTRNEAIFYIKELQKTYASMDKKVAEAVDMAIEALQDRPKGEWIKKQVFNPELDKYVPLIECSVCGYEPYFGGSESKFNYCANCGARMEK